MPLEGADADGIVRLQTNRRDTALDIGRILEAVTRVGCTAVGLAEGCLLTCSIACRASVAEVAYGGENRDRGQKEGEMEYLHRANGSSASAEF
jgi:hypothetical protein